MDYMNVLRALVVPQVVQVIDETVINTRVLPYHYKHTVEQSIVGTLQQQRKNGRIFHKILLDHIVVTLSRIVLKPVQNIQILDQQ